MKIRQALIWGVKNLNNSKSSALDAEVLLVFVLKKEKTWLFSHLDDDLSSKLINKYKKLILRRKKGEPIAYITHYKEFFGLDFYVDKNVLIPRPETELLVEETLKYAKKKKKILDIGTGSGCIIIAMAKTLSHSHSEFISESNKMLKQVQHDKKIKYYATDLSNKALEIARKNAKKHKAKIHFIKSNLFKNISKNLKFDIIIANLPYLDPRWIDAELLNEPQASLNGGKNGLAIINNFLSQTKNYLKKNGKIILEIDPRQKESTKKSAKNYFSSKNVTLKKDLSSSPRVIIIS
jgi:release factor glutamine methyltransferase